MAKLIRFLSGRWTTRNVRSTDLNSGGGGGRGGGQKKTTMANGRHQQRSRSADHHGQLMCKVALLDGTDVILDVPRRSVGAALYEKVFNHLDLIETEYFGLQFSDELNIQCWLDSTKPIRRQVQLEKNSHGEQMYVFRFRVKFYSSDPNNLKEEITRYQFFLQLKSDVETGRLHCPKDTMTAVDLAALVLQAEVGDYDESQHSLGFVSQFKFLPNQTEDMETAILKKFKTYRGLTPSRCELIYLNKAKCLELYGVDFNIVRGKDDNEYQLGLMPSGILVCERSQKIGLFCWPKITKLQFKKKRLHLEVVESDDRGLEQEHTFIFRLDSEKACKVLWRCAVEHHTFFRLSSPIKPYGLKSDFFRLGSRVRYSGSTELQTVNKIVQHRDIKFQRRLSKRCSRREKFERQEKGANNGNESYPYGATKRWSVVVGGGGGTQDSSNNNNSSSSGRRKSRADLYSAEMSNHQTTTITRPTTAATVGAGVGVGTGVGAAGDDASSSHRSSMQRRRSRNYSSGRRSPSTMVIDSDNNNVTAMKAANFAPVQVTVSTQESFEDDFEQRAMNGSSSLRKSHRGPVASKERLFLQPQSPSSQPPLPALPVSTLRGSTSATSSSSAAAVVSRPNERGAARGQSSSSVAWGVDTTGQRSRQQPNAETMNRRRQSITLPEKNHRHQTTGQSSSSNNNRNDRQPHQPLIDSMPLISYSSLHMPRGRSRGSVGGGGMEGGGMGGGGGERDLTSKLQSQSYFPPRQTPHRLSMLHPPPQQQEFHQFKESYSEDLRHRGMGLSQQNNDVVHYQVSTGRRNNWSVDNLYNVAGHQSPPSSSSHFVSHKYPSSSSYADERPPAAAAAAAAASVRPSPAHRTNLATQV